MPEKTKIKHKSRKTGESLNLSASRESAAKANGRLASVRWLSVEQAARAAGIGPSARQKRRLGMK